MSWEASFRLYSKDRDGNWQLYLDCKVLELWQGRVRFDVKNGSWYGSIGPDGLMWVERGEGVEEHDLKGGKYRFEYTYKDEPLSEFADLDEIPF